MKEGGITDQELSVRAGFQKSTVNTFFRKEEPVSPSIDRFIAMAKAMGVQPGWLLQGEDPFRLEIPVVGIVSAGENFIAADDTRGETVAFDIGDRDVIAIEVRGESMAPVYRPGDVLVCHRNIGRQVDNLIGLDCAVRTRTGENYIKILKRGSRVGLYNLKSFNPLHNDIEDVQIDWAAPVAWVKRRR